MGASENLTVSLPDGSTVGYAVYGDPAGTPVLALHGAPACRLMFAIADAEARVHGLRIVAPDRPGYGLTPRDDAPTLSLRAQMLRQFVDAVGLKRFSVLGVSGGAPYAVALSALVPDRVCVLALVSPMGPVADYQKSANAQVHPLSFWHKQFFLHVSQQTWLTSPMGGLLGALARSTPERLAALNGRVAHGRDGALLSRPHVRAYFAGMLREAFRQGAKGAISDLAIFGRPWGVDYARIQSPTIIWQSVDDAIVPVDATRYLAGLIPQSSFRPIAGDGHFWVLDHTFDVLSVIASFPRT